MPRINDRVRSKARARLLNAVVDGCNEADSDKKISKKRVAQFTAFSESLEEYINEHWAIPGTIHLYRNKIVEMSHALSNNGKVLVRDYLDKPDELAEVDWLLFNDDNDVNNERNWMPISHQEIKQSRLIREDEFPVVGKGNDTEQFQAQIPAILGLSAEQVEQTSVKCRFCGSRDLFTDTAQTRSADESQTAKYKCRTCGKGWSVS